MKNFLVRCLSTTIVLLAACGGAENDFSDPNEALDETTSVEELCGYHLNRQQIIDVARDTIHTARYLNQANAFADGFVDSGLPCVEGQGFHLIRPDRLNTYDVTQPTILVYSPSGRLVATEWATPVDAVGGVRPVLFGETYHGPVLDPPLYVLHVWNWMCNSAGIFSDTNPRVHCPQ